MIFSCKTHENGILLQYHKWLISLLSKLFFFIKLFVLLKKAKLSKIYIFFKQPHCLGRRIFTLNFRVIKQTTILLPFYKTYKNVKRVTRSTSFFFCHPPEKKRKKRRSGGLTKKRKQKFVLDFTFFITSSNDCCLLL